MCGSNLNVIGKLYYIVSENPSNKKEKHNAERTASNDAEDSLFRKIPTELKDGFSEFLYLRGKLYELENEDAFVEGFVSGARLMLEVLRKRQG